MKTPPPVSFAELADAMLPPALKSEVSSLLDLKLQSPERKMIPRVAVINDFLDASLEEIQNEVDHMPGELDHDWNQLNRFFLSVLNIWNGSF